MTLAIPLLNGARSRLVRSLMTSDDVYGADYCAELDQEALSSAGAIVRSVLRDFAPRSAIDVGCGTGAILAALAAAGVRCTGLERSKAALAYCRGRGLNVVPYDLTSRNDRPFGSGFDVVLSLEVAEHLPKQAADRFVGLLTRLGKRVIFTAATPGQGGRDHVNEQPAEYWIERFARHGFSLDEARSLKWREEWKEAGTAPWYNRNLLVFVERSANGVGSHALPSSQ
jgi:SAM-dependent methyltransferase